MNHDYHIVLNIVITNIWNVYLTLYIKTEIKIKINIFLLEKKDI